MLLVSSKLPTVFKLDSKNKKLLFDDVKSFWEKTDLKSYKDNFKHGI